MPYANKYEQLQKDLEKNQKKSKTITTSLQLLCVGLEDYPIIPSAVAKKKRLSKAFKQIKDIFLENKDDIDEGLLNEGSLMVNFDHLNTIKMKLGHFIEKLNNKHTDELRKLIVEKKEIEKKIDSLVV